MKFDIPKVVKRMDLADYASEYSGQAVHVWVNPPMKLLERIFELKRRAAEILQEAMAQPHPHSGKASGAQGGVKTAKPTPPSVPPQMPAETAGHLERDELEAIGREMMGIFAELWSQGPKGTEISAAEIEELIGVSIETDPRFYGWLQARTLDLIGEHRSGLKKD